MSDDPRPPPKEPLELEFVERPAEPPAPAPVPAPRSPSSNPNAKAVRSASREQPLPGAPRPNKKVTREKLQEGFIDTVLNSVSILGDMLEDFRSSDKFFKYKALVLVLWFSLIVGAFGVACPTSDHLTNDIDARLVTSVVGSNTVYMVKNESTGPWENVVVQVNGRYSTVVSVLEPENHISLNILADSEGTRAPIGLQITDIVIQIGTDAPVALMENGVTH